MTWIDIPGYFYHYQINDLGQVRKETAPGTYREIKGQLMTSGSTFRVVRLTVNPKQYRRVLVTALMRDAFLGGKREGYRVIHRNGATTDDELCNLEMITDYAAGHRRVNNRRGVVKIDRHGNELAFYPSIQEAGRREHMGQKAIIARCKGRLKRNEFSLCEFSFRYDQ